MNLTELVDVGDPVVVAQKIGMRTSTNSRGRVLVECPSHLKNLGKEDTKLGNCYITPKGYCCFACGAKGNFIQMAADFWKMPYESFNDKVSVANRICEEVYPEYKMYADHGKKDITIKADDMILTPAEIEYIGLSAYVPVREFDVDKFDKTDKEEMKVSSTYSAAAMMRDDPLGFIFMAFGKAFDKYQGNIFKRELIEGYDMSMFKSVEDRAEYIRKAQVEVDKAYEIGGKLERAIDNYPDMTYEEKQEFKRMLKTDVIDTFFVDDSIRAADDKICVVSPSGDSIGGKELEKLGLLRTGIDMNGNTSLEYVSSSLTGTLIANDIATIEKGALSATQLAVIRVSGTSCIESGAFENSKVREVFIDNNALHVESGAFTGCTNLDSLEFAKPKDVVEIQEGAFARCDSLRELRIGEHSKVFDSPEQIRLDRVGDLRPKPEKLPEIKISVNMSMPAPKNLNFSPEMGR